MRNKTLIREIAKMIDHSLLYLTMMDADTPGDASPMEGVVEGKGY